jgi:hypothetical protein
MAPFVYHQVSFEAARVAGGGWCVEIRCPNGGKVELHDFQTEAGAKAWIAECKTMGGRTRDAVIIRRSREATQRVGNWARFRAARLESHLAALAKTTPLQVPTSRRDLEMQPGRQGWSG